MKRLAIFFMVLVSATLISGCSKQSSEEQVAEGITLRDGGNVQGAIVLFKSVLEDEPNHFSARYQLGSTLLETGHLEKAEKELLKVSVQSPDYLEVNLRLSEIYLATDRPDDAIRFIKKQLEANPDDTEAIAQLAYVELKQENTDEAEKIFKQALEKDSNSVTAKIGLANIYLASPWPERARPLLTQVMQVEPDNASPYHMMAVLEKIKGDTEALKAIYETLVENVPDDARGAKVLGMLRFLDGDAEKTLAMSDLIFTHHIESPDAYLLKGLSSYLNEDYKAAFVNLQKSATNKPSLSTIYFLGLTHFKLGELELALNQFQRCLDRKPEIIQPRLMLAMTYLRQGRTEESEAEAQKILDVDSVNALAYNILGSSLLSLGRFEEGIDALSTATQLDPNLASAHLQKGLYHLNREANYREGEKDLSMALSLSPETLNTRLILAIQYIRRKDLPKALDTLKEGLTDTKSDAILHALMAQVYFQQEKMQAAVTELSEAKRLRPGLLSPYYTLAAYYLAMGKIELALAEYEAMLTLVPDNTTALISAGQTAHLLGDDEQADKYLKKAAYAGVNVEYRAYMTFLVNRGDSQKALEMLDEMVKMSKSSYLPLEDKGLLLLSMGKQVDALATFRTLTSVAPSMGVRHTVSTLLKMGERVQALNVVKEIIRLNPQDQFGYLLSAKIAQEDADHDGALKTLTEALDVVTDKRPIRMAVSTVYESMGEPAKARSNLEELLKDHPSYVPGIFALGSLESRVGEYGRAEAHYKAVLELQPRNSYALNNLAFLYADNYDNIDTAFPYAIRAYKNDSSNPAIMETLGYVLYKQGKLDKAGQLLEEVKKALPDNPTVNYHLAQVYSESSRDDEAAELLKLALNMGDFPERSRAEKLLKSLAGKK